jgi:hypothetical protein
MILTTSSGEFPIPSAVAAKLPEVPDLPDPSARDGRQQVERFRAWLDASPDHVIAYERLRRWQMVQEELAAAARKAGRRFEVTTDGLD